MRSINRNVSIVVVLLVLVVIAGYLIWLRSRVEQPVSPQSIPEVTATPEATLEVTATPSATPGTGEATGPARQRTATPGGTAR